MNRLARYFGLGHVDRLVGLVERRALKRDLHELGRGFGTRKIAPGPTLSKREAAARGAIRRFRIRRGTAAAGLIAGTGVAYLGYRYWKKRKKA